MKFLLRFYCIGTIASIVAGFGLQVDTEATGDYRNGFIFHMVNSHVRTTDSMDCPVRGHLLKKL